MTIELPVDAQARLDAHLDAVEQALISAGYSRERRRGVVDDLEAQVLDMLASQSANPSLEDIEGVLTRLDPPSAYGEGAASHPPAPVTPVDRPAASLSPAKPRYSKLAIAGLICILLSFLMLPLILIPTWIMWQRAASAHQLEEARIAVPQGVEAGGGPRAQTVPTPMEPRVEAKLNWSVFSCILIFIGPLALAATLLGWIAFGQIRSSGGALRGTGLALFDGLFYPVLILAMTLILA